jgi:hypothetical protein
MAGAGILARRGGGRTHFTTNASGREARQVTTPPTGYSSGKVRDRACSRPEGSCARSCTSRRPASKATTLGHPTASSSRTSAPYRAHPDSRGAEVSTSAAGWRTQCVRGTVEDARADSLTRAGTLQSADSHVSVCVRQSAPPPPLQNHPRYQAPHRWVYSPPPPGAPR